MIIISKRHGKIEDRDYSEPSKELSAEEKRTVIAVWGDEEYYWYFTEDKESADWKAYQNHISNV
jgi:uncharacterized protein YneR